jgi:hypothetical protein
MTYFNMTYFKATRPDGTDFYSGKVLYAVGKGVYALPFKGEPRLCGPGVLHASDVPAETLIGGRWPCRLFEVTGTPFLSAGHKHGFKRLMVVRELDAHLALGPNGREVAALIERARRLTLKESKALHAAWVVTRGTDWDAARDAVVLAARGITWDAAWHGAMNGARYAAMDASGDAAWRGAMDAAWAEAWHPAWHAAWEAARYAAWGAAIALVVRGLITLEQFDVLYDPWASVIGV